MYGIGFTDGAASFISGTGFAGWGMYVAADGDARVYLSGANGTVASTGQHYVGSNVVWNAGNDGAGSGLDADLLDGLNLHNTQGTQNVANTVLRTQVNGYTMLGWINTTSGVASGTPTRIYCSQDSYVRYYTPASLAPYILNQGSTKNAHVHSEYLTSNADDTFSGDLVSTSRNRGIFGTYNSTKTDHIWSMGAAYKNHASGTNFGNMYGFSYKHTNNSTGGTMAGGHMAVWCQNGTPNAAIGTNIWTSGNVTAYSDIRVKTNIEHIPNALDKVCKLNGYTFDRTDFVVDEITGIMPNTRQTGVIAQEVLEILPEAVTGTEEGHYSVAYGNMVGLLIESIKELKGEVDDLKKQLEAK
jgi:hypothetical protein